MIISHSRRFVFIHIHKTAGESVTEALAPHLSRSDLAPGRTFLGALRNTYYAKRHKVIKHATAEAVRDRLGDAVWNDYFTFGFVRNPYDRAQSLYAFYAQIAERRRSRSLVNLQYRLPGVKSRDPLLWPGVTAYFETSSFSEFIRHPNFSPERLATRPQRRILSDAEGRIIVDFVGRFETLAADFATVAERVGLPQARLGRQNVSRNSARRTALSAADRDVLYAMYEEDFDAFGYPKDPA